MLAEHHRVVVADGGGQQALCVIGVRGQHHLDARHMHEHVVERLRVLRPRAGARANHRADDHRHIGATTEHVPELGDLVEDLVEANADEVDEHQLGHRPQAREGCATGHADDGGFGDRGVDDTAATKLRGKTGGDAEGAAGGFLDTTAATEAAYHVLADNDHAVVAAHLQLQGFVDCITYVLDWHVSSSRRRRCRGHRGSASGQPWR